MARELRLIRRVVAGAGGWAGDGAVWTVDSPPVPAGAPAVEVTKPILFLPMRRTDAHDIPVRGCAGIIRVIGDDSARRFEMRLHVEWLFREGPTKTRDWRLLTNSDPGEFGDGEDFTTDPVHLQDQNVAFHLTPLDGPLEEGTRVEIWAAEI